MKTVLELPKPATSISYGPTFHQELGRSCTLCMEYDDGKKSVVLVFEGVEAFKCAYQAAVDVSLVNAAYNKLVDLGETEWLQKTCSNLEAALSDASGLQHLAVFFDDDSAYEFVCRGFKALEEG